VSWAVKIDHLTPDEWCTVLLHFRDACVFQTYGVGVHSPEGAKVDHVVLAQNGAPVAAAQVQRIVCADGERALVQRGPMWLPVHRQADGKSVELILREIVAEYAARRQMLVCVYPAAFEETSGDLLAVLRHAGFLRVSRGMGTFVLDLTPTLDQLRSNMRKSWRRDLRKSERNSLRIEFGVGDDLFSVFVDLYNEMRERKGIRDEDDTMGLRSAQALLLPVEKMQIVIAYAGVRPVAATVVSTLGSMAISVLGASSSEGRRLRASYLIEWFIITLLRQQGLQSYDLGGVHASKNPGVYRYKEGVGGQFFTYLGEFRWTGELRT
jgi:hypothetical protein